MLNAAKEGAISGAEGGAIGGAIAGGAIKPKAAPTASKTPVAETELTSGPAKGPRPFQEDPVPAGCHSFDPSTPVLMADGTSKPIGQVELGDKVKATDPTTGASQDQTVVALHLNNDNDLADITVTDITTGKTSVLHTTWTHPFWNADRHEWTDAKDLTPGTHLRSPDGGTTQMVTAIKTWTGLHWMNDLTIADTHTYYVIAGGTPVLVHNCGGVDYHNPSDDVDDLVNAVHNQRIADENTGNNYAAARYTDANGDTQIIVRRSSAGRGNHAEGKIFRDVDPASITDLYSELQPCQTSCKPMLAKYPGINVSWSWDWTTSAEGAASRAAQSAAVRQLF